MFSHAQLNRRTFFQRIAGVVAALAAATAKPPKANLGVFISRDQMRAWENLHPLTPDVQFIESQHFEVEEICRWFNVPPALAFTPQELERFRQEGRL